MFEQLIKEIENLMLISGNDYTDGFNNAIQQVLKTINRFFPTEIYIAYKSVSYEGDEFIACSFDLEKLKKFCLEQYDNHEYHTPISEDWKVINDTGENWFVFQFEYFEIIIRKVEIQ